MRDVALIVTCEHGGNRVPARYAPLLRGRRTLLASHRGWDAGALQLAREMARALRAPLFAATTTRLLVDLNRAEHNRRVFSELTANLPDAERERLLATLHRPYRTRVEAAVAQRVATGGRVVHIASHSFTPRLDGAVRAYEIGLLYDPRRAGERDLCTAWREALLQRAARLRVRRNQPYRGVADGLTTHLRTRFADRCYAGIELEINQAVVGRPAAWRALRRTVIEALRDVL